MADTYKRATISDLRGGRNGVDPPLALRETECVDAVNVDYFHTTLGRKRNGLSSSSTMFSSGGPFTGKLSSLFRHVPSTNEAAAELWAVDDATTPVIGRKASSTFFVAPTVKDPLSGNGWDVDFATLAGKCFIAYPSASSFTAPAAPTVGNTGSGTYAAVLRYYRVRWVLQVAGVTTLRSGVGTGQSFTPSGSGAAARVTRPSAPGQNETHWELEVSYDNTNFRVLYGDGGLNGAIPIATTTGDDTTVLSGVTTIETFTSSGTWSRPSWVTSVSYLMVGGGGGGGAAGGGGGGGGGRVRASTAAVSASSYAIAIGAGGTGSTGANDATAGGNTTWNSLTAEGGSQGADDGLNGASGTIGGGGGADQGAGGGNGGTGTVHSGGGGASNGAGGGGGSSADGASSGGFNTGGAGGAGTSSSISGSAVVYGGGGGGAANITPGAGGTGGGGAGVGGTGTGTAGTTNRGGGGGGGRFGNGGAGGSGIVIISYTSNSISSAGLSQDQNVDRLHVWDGATVRRAGFATPSAPTAADAGSGSYATIRYYRVRWTEQSGGITVRRSEPGATRTITPSGSGASVTVTQPAVANEGETHWEVEGSADGVTFYLLSTVAIATTTYSDSAAVSTYTSGTLSAATGVYSAQKAYRFIAADQGRLLGFGNWTATSRQNDIEISSVTGSLNVGDAERVDTTSTYRYTLDENDSGAPTGLRGPVFGNFYAFKDRQFWELSPTGLPSNPYRRIAISKTIGCVQRPASCIGEDAQGNAALYFMSHRGLYQYGAAGLTYIGKGIEDYVLGPTATINLNATKVIAWVLYYPFKRQVWVGWATGSSNDPCQMGIYDVTTGGWSRVPTGDSPANVRCGALFSGTIAASMSKDLKPYLGSATVANTLYKADDETVTADNGTPFQAYVLTRPVEPGGPGFNGHVGDAVLLAPAASGVTITATTIPDFNATYAKTGTALLTATGGETRVSRRLENSRVGNTQFVQYQIGDASAVSNGWALDRLVIPYAQDEAVSG